MLLLPAWDYLLVTFVCAFLGIYLCQEAAQQLGVHDHPAIVWDEFVGLWITLTPLVFLGFGWLWLIVGILLFRFFDIVKPWPIRYFDRHVQGGLGIMLDDVVAGLISAGLLTGLMLWPF